MKYLLKKVGACTDYRSVVGFLGIVESLLRVIVINFQPPELCACFFFLISCLRAVVENVKSCI